MQVFTKSQLCQRLGAHLAIMEGVVKMRHQVQVMQVLQDHALLLKGLRLAQVFTLEHLRGHHNVPMPPRPVHLQRQQDASPQHASQYRAAWLWSLTHDRLVIEARTGLYMRDCVQ